MSDLVKALLHFKGSVPGKDLENGYCTTKYFRIEVGNNNNIHNRCIFWLVALRSELIKNEWKFLKLSKVLYYRISSVCRDTRK